MAHPRSETHAPRRDLDAILTGARVRDRYADYDLAAAEQRLLRRQATRPLCPRYRSGDPLLTREVSMTWPTAWTEPDDGSPQDLDRAWWDLKAVSMAVLHDPDAGEQLDQFIRDRYAHRAGARVFACLLHLTGHRDGARFWWQFAAGAGDYAAEYCLFLDHTRRGEYADAGHWGKALEHHHFNPHQRWGRRETAPVVADDLPTHTTDLTDLITEQRHPDLGPIPLPHPDLVDELRDFTHTY